MQTAKIIRLPADNTFLSCVIYEGYLQFLRHGSIKKALRESRNLVPKGANLGLVGNDISMMKKGSPRIGVPEQLLSVIAPQKYTHDEIEKRVREGRVYRNILDEDFFREIIDNLDADPRIIADVLTDPNGKRVLEVGTGYFYKIIMLYPVNGKLAIGAGFVLSFYEFMHPMSQRLTDEEWRKIIKEYDTPEWTRSFILKEK